MTDGMSENDMFHDVCPECGRQIAVAGHDPDCPNADDERSVDTATDHGGGSDR